MWAEISADIKKHKSIMIPNNIVFKGDNDLALTNSLLVAEKFGKEHHNVIKAIETLLGGVVKSNDTPIEDTQRMFEKSTYINPQNGQVYPMYIMNRDGFSLLVMGFKGKKALQFKLEFINAFNEMERIIKENKPKLSQAEFLLQQAQMFVEMERRTTNIENEIAEMKKEREEATYALLTEQYLSKDSLPELSEAKQRRQNIRRMINDYSAATGLRQQDIWHDIYAKLYYQYGKSINSYKKRDSDKTKLDIAERVGLLPQIHAIVSSMVRSVQRAM